jgi:hypothetical protein
MLMERFMTRAPEHRLSIVKMAGWYKMVYLSYTAAATS